MTEILSPWWALVLVGGLLLAAAASFALEAAVASGRGRAGVGAALRAPFAEAARLLRQRRRDTVSADRLLWRLASSALLPVALLMLALVPFGGHVLSDAPLGVVWFNALDVSVWALIWLLGWGPNATLGLVGAYRFLAMALAYELPLMFALVAPAVAAGSLQPAVIAQAQQEGLWYAVWMPVAFGVYCLGVLGFSVKSPMDAGAGTDLAGGVLAEVTAADRLLVEVGRHALLVAGSAVAVPLFLGGGEGPLLPGWTWVVLKTLALSATLLLVGRRLPTLRPDKFLELGWVVLLPLVVLQDLVVAIVAVSGR